MGNRATENSPVTYVLTQLAQNVLTCQGTERER